MNDTEMYREFSVNFRKKAGPLEKNAVEKRKKICYNKNNNMESITFSEGRKDGMRDET